VEHLPGRPSRNVYELSGIGRELLHDLLAEQAAADLVA
jgi:DNA-binding PadR family transcriptional regulator